MNLTILGMNEASDKAILPQHYISFYQVEPYYQGDGVHSVHALQTLCKEYKERCHQQAIVKNELIQKILKLNKTWLTHKQKFNNIVKNRQIAFENNIDTAEYDEQIVLLASILGEINREILLP